jgi:hypothetical protein
MAVKALPMTQQQPAEDSIPLWAWLMAMAALAFGLRAWLPNVVAFGIDESIAASLATQIAYGKTFPLAGIRTSFGFLNPPTYLYLLAPFFRLTSDPALVALFPMFLGSLAVVFAGLAGDRLGGRHVALLAAAIVCLSPNAVEHSRRLWGHDLQVFLGAVACWGALQQTTRGLVISFASAAIAQTCHLTGILLWLPGLVIVGRNLRERWPALAIGFAIGGFLYLPWLIHQLLNGWPDLGIVWGALTTGGTTRDLGHAVTAGGAWVMLLADSWNHDLLGAPRPWSITPITSAVLSVGALLLLAIGLSAAVTRMLRHEVPERSDLLALTLPVLAAPVIFGVILQATVPPYQLPVLAPMALLAAYGCDRVIQTYRWLGIVTSIAVALWLNIALAHVLVVRHALAEGAGSSPTLAEQKTIVRTIRATIGNQRFRMAQDSRRPETGIDIAYIYLFHWAGIGDRFSGFPVHFFVVTSDGWRAPHPAARAFLRPHLLGETERLRLYELPTDSWDGWAEVIRIIHALPTPPSKPEVPPAP